MASWSSGLHCSSLAVRQRETDGERERSWKVGREVERKRGSGKGARLTPCVSDMMKLVQVKCTFSNHWAQGNRIPGRGLTVGRGGVF